jgi:ligand-binding sensor domain-containing protein
LLLGVLAAQAQYRFDHWTTDNGLPNNSIWMILQTRDGYLWLTTSQGLVRFDGVRLTIFDKSNSPGITACHYLVFSSL